MAYWSSPAFRADAGRHSDSCHLAHRSQTLMATLSMNHRFSRQASRSISSLLSSVYEIIREGFCSKNWLDLFVAEESVELLPDVITCNASPGHQLSPHKSGQGLFSQPASKPNRRLTRLFCPCLASELLHVLMFACSQSASQPASQPASHQNTPETTGQVLHTHICTYTHM